MKQSLNYNVIIFELLWLSFIKIYIVLVLRNEGLVFVISICYKRMIENLAMCTLNLGSSGGGM